jgi:3-deoxy-D-manno-octulosonate 8-phosphate phosphatase (KDO 8-P phosphatase)
MKQASRMSLIDQFKKINTFIFDIDGVLTDGTILILRDGLQARQMHVKDGFGLQMAVKKGYNVLVISGGYSEESKLRLEKLGIMDVYIGILDKMDFVKKYIDQNKISFEQVLYMGDDLPDLPLMNTVGLAACPADAVNEIRAACHYISPIKGGWGSVRDVIEKVLKINDHWKFDETMTSR